VSPGLGNGETWGSFVIGLIILQPGDFCADWVDQMHFRTCKALQQYARSFAHDKSLHVEAQLRATVGEGWHGTI
jgi:hypothetical protein